MNSIHTTEPPIVALQLFCEKAGIAPITAWRFRRRGWLETINIAGRQYVTREAVEEFKRRAAAGEFARQHVVPMRARVRTAIPGSVKLSGSVQG